MIGLNKLKLNQATIAKAIEFYLNEHVMQEQITVTLVTHFPLETEVTFELKNQQEEEEKPSNE